MHRSPTAAVLYACILNNTLLAMSMSRSCIVDRVLMRARERSYDVYTNGVRAGLELLPWLEIDIDGIK